MNFLGQSPCGVPLMSTGFIRGSESCAQRKGLGAVAQLITQELSWCVRAFPKRAHKYFCAHVSVSCVSRREQGTDVCWITFLCSPWLLHQMSLWAWTHRAGEATCWVPHINRNKCIFGYLQTCDCWENEFPRTGKLEYKYNGLCRLLAGDPQVCSVCVMLAFKCNEKSTELFFAGLGC